MESKKNIKKIKEDDRGFTLMELIIALAISAFIILAAYTFVIVGIKSYNSTSKTTTLQNEVTETNDLIGEAIREAKPSVTQITNYPSGKIELYTGKKVFLYVPGSKSLYVSLVDASKAAGTGSYDFIENEDNLVCSCIDSLSMTRVKDSSKEAETDASGNTIEGSQDSNVINVKIEFNYRSRKDTSDVNYYIRSNS